ncbi:MAG: replication-relaxation family protein [Anaerolineae bacterium]|nr:replication-relaxation family protein [Anaerolineae bacterium]
MTKLYDNAYIWRRAPSMNSAAIYGIDQRGVVELRKQGIEAAANWHRSNRAISDFFIEHCLGIVNVYVALAVACRGQGYQLSAWRSEGALKADYDRIRISNTSVPVIPDAFFTLTTAKRPFSFCLELDRATMTLVRMKQEKYQAYIEYYKSGAYEKRFGTTSLRVLTVVPSERRMAYVKAAAESAGAGSMFWFAVANDLTPATVFSAPVWSIAGREHPASLLD